MKEAILLTDGYKLDHRRQYPEGTEYVYSNWTPRSCHFTIVLGLLPIANIILFTAFIIYYAIHAGWNPNECEGYIHVFSLRGENIVTRGLLKVKNLLCKRV